MLLVEDDRLIHEALKPLLTREGYAVEVAENGVDAEFLGLECPFDLIILDLGLPDKNGLEVLKSWRQQGMDTPVLILTARDAWHERVDGLKAGADDYLGKPFYSEELLARLQAISRRGAGHASNQLSWNGVSLDIDSQRANTRDGREIELTAIEFRLLRALMQEPRQVHSKTSLSERMYEEEQLRDSNVIEVYINRLRQHFGKDYIETRRGQGYRLRDGESLAS
nr:response regulator transcription factor [Oceanobacter mangrovi]